MKTLYWKLAWHGIYKNQKIYLPFLLTSIGITMMYYIVSYLTYSKAIYEMHGGQEMQMILSWGTGVVAIFAAIFLFYMNSFLMRRRKTEFGLYNILGMGKWNIARILCWQNGMLFGTSIVGGLGLGILLSKLSELMAAKMLGNGSPMGFRIEPNAVRNTILLTAVSYGIILLYSLGQIHVSKPIALLRGEKQGEKPPKARWLLTLCGLVMLGIAYYLSVTIQQPIAAFSMFFLAVVLVILATYLLFICGSVALCKLLQKNKRYYYQLQHFISVSSMRYRMKRNGSSLASICVLSTMVLVMISSTLCLYLGSEDGLYQRYPKAITITASASSGEQEIEDIISEVLSKHSLQAKNEEHYTTLQISGLMNGNQLQLDRTDAIVNYDDIATITIFTLSEYNRLAGTSETLADGEVLLSVYHGTYSGDTIQIGTMQPFHIQKQVPKFLSDGNAFANMSRSLYLIVPDEATVQEIDAVQVEAYGANASQREFYEGFDLDADADTEIAVWDALQARLAEASDDILRYSCESREDGRSSFYSLYGGLLFLGILLSVVFLFGTVLIMYYKQISEGYEDAGRFEILQKVGMTKKEIKRSINSQILTVFTAPLLMAGVHLAFAFPMLHRLLVLMGLTNISLFAIITVGGFLVFAALYALMYKLTSHSYYQLVKS